MDEEIEAVRNKLDLVKENSMEKIDEEEAKMRAASETAMEASKDELAEQLTASGQQVRRGAQDT